MRIRKGRRGFAASPSSSFKKPFASKPLQKHPYGEDWSSISASIKKRDNYTCRAEELGLPRCGKQYRPPFQHLLEAHHILSYEKYRSHNPKYLITVCRDCHHRIHDRQFSKPITDKQKRAARTIR